ncbi:protein kinase C and casein kinase substrate in neurons protein 1 isoform X3 [Neocloeon triangulifer]|uniref:protein kinase C and casein kinase substrate in neurons protein 1 isoform X3 n=1 Tax=Neocloeon triangulifer TaxID=2078957 RepID=UPI00286F659D|nr:protein kinase C and casein kinase substrate in neurons protein 1 isoform X3 [Neocloeon triangulifer]
MSHHSDDNMLIATSDSFWEPNNYKRTTKRIEDGYKLSSDLITLIQERAEIERNYARSLKTWSKKWNELIEKGPEYGTSEAACKGVLVEADRLCDLHTKVRDNLCNDVVTQVKNWQKENYKKSMMQIKERKDMEDNFKKAQKPWAKLLTKVNKAKADYHNACKTERSATNQERNATGDSSLSQDQRNNLVKKMQDRVQKSKEEVQKCKDKYNQALKEITEYNPKYMEDMTVVFEKCQENEAQRLLFFKEILFSIHKHLNISQDPTLPQIYEEFYHTINNADQGKDLKWWSNNHGINMAMNWPQFEEFPPTNNKSSKSKVTAARMISNDVSDGKDVKGSKEKVDSIRQTTPTITNGKSPQQQQSQHSSDSTPFDNDEEEWEDDSALKDNGEPGVPVKALYDYEGAESDELSFKIGDVFEKLEDEDEQGWCKGRKDGRVGLYPANYVAAV